MTASCAHRAHDEAGERQHARLVAATLASPIRPCTGRPTHGMETLTQRGTARVVESLRPVALRLSACALGLSLLVGAARANEGSEGERVRVEYKALEGCPDQPTFEAELVEHLGNETLTRLGELARTLVVTIAPVSGGFSARVELVDRQGSSVERVISAPTCEQAVRAIALIAALAARSQVEQTEHPDEGKAPGVARATAEAAPARPPAASHAPSVRRAPSAEHTPAVAARPRAMIFGLFGGVGVATGVGPRVAPGVLALFRAALAGNPEHSLVLSAMGYDTFRSIGTPSSGPNTTRSARKLTPSRAASVTAVQRCVALPGVCTRTPSA